MRRETGFLFIGAVVGAAVSLLYSSKINVRTIKKTARRPPEPLDSPLGNISRQVAVRADDMTKVVKEGVAYAKKLSAAGRPFIPIFPANAQRAAELSTEKVQ